MHRPSCLVNFAKLTPAIKIRILLQKGALVMTVTGLIFFPWRGTRASWSDTDADGHRDTWTDPISLVSTSYANMNLVSLDVDADGASNSEEASAGTNPYHFDTDVDGLSDGDEIHLLHTNPLVSDTDGDGIWDYVDPYPGDPYNFSDVNSRFWYGDVNRDADNDSIPNWQDSDPSPPDDDDGDGYLNSVDPFTNDYSNYSYVNGTAWYSDVFGDPDNDYLANWQDSHPGDFYNGNPMAEYDRDADGMNDAIDPVPLYSNNPSPHNGLDWVVDTALHDQDQDGVLNWYDTDPYGLHLDSDGDGLTVEEESTYGTSDSDVDCDDDGLTDYEEVMIYSTSPTYAYTLASQHGWGEFYTDYFLVDLTDADEDQIPDKVELHFGLDPNDELDGGGDLDGNGITNFEQYQAGCALNADLSFYDSDEDGMSDVFEICYQFDRYNLADSLQDRDNDGVLNFEEYQLHLSPSNTNTGGTAALGDLLILMEKRLYPYGGAQTVDADNNLIPDWADTALVGANPYFTRQAVDDLDGDTLPDWWEHYSWGKWKFPANGLDIRVNEADLDGDGDGLANRWEYLLWYSPVITDSDGDGINDGDEDYDGDLLTNRQEAAFGFDPSRADSDFDGVLDSESVRPFDTDSDGLLNAQEALLGTRVSWKDNPAVGLEAESFLSP